MNRSIHSACGGVAVGLLVSSAAALAMARTWTDATDKHKTEAELISATQTEVHLRLSDGTQRTIPLKRLSVADRAFVRKHLAGNSGPAEAESKPSSDEKGASDAVRQIAEKFYQDLRTKERDAAKADSLNVVPRQSGSQQYSAEYFTEEVRRQLNTLYGEDQLYGGGLSVRTTLEPKLQEYARRSLMDGLIDYDHGKGFRGPVASVDITGDWGPAVAAIKPLRDVPEWTLAVVLSMDSNEAQIGLRPENDIEGKLLADRVVGTLSGPDVKWVSKKLDAILKTWPADRILYFADEAGGEPFAPARGPAAILIGPEGGFTDEERAAIRALPLACPVSLGPRILRADTAAVAALALVQSVLGDWR